MGRAEAHRLGPAGRPDNVAGLPEEFNPLFGSDIWEKLPQKERDEFGRHQGSWLFSQFLHGEQGALTVAARIVESVPDLDSKFYAATQVMDEARHVELYKRFMHEKIGLYYPINQDLAKLLEDVAERQPLGHALPRHAGAHRGPGARRVRPLPRHLRRTRWSSSSSRTSCRTRRGTSRSAGWRCGLLRAS